LALILVTEYDPTGSAAIENNVQCTTLVLVLVIVLVAGEAEALNAHVFPV